MISDSKKAISPTIKKTAALLLGVAVFAAIWIIRPSGLEHDGVMCLALSMMTVIWWATGAIPPGFSAMLLMVGFVLLLNPVTVNPALVFRFWVTPTLYLAVGGYIIAHAVEDCGLGRRISILFVEKFVRTYRGCIISCYVLNFVLSILIPQPWPRSFLIMSVMRYIIKESGVTGKYAANIGLAAFASAVPTSMILLTGDSVLNSLVSVISGEAVSYQSWLLYMGIPGILATVLTCVIQLFIFGAPSGFVLDRDKIAGEAKQLGKVSSGEIKVMVVLLLAVVLWMTDTITGINPGWIALLAVGVMALPFMSLVNNEAWKKIPYGTLMFVSAAVALGAVGGVTGMNAWLAASLLPSVAVGNLISFAAVAVLFCILMHMCLGSTMTVMSIVGVAIVTFGGSAGIPPLVCAMLSYCAIALHWLLPFHHMNIMVGIGDEGGGFTNAMVIKMGAFQTLTALIVSAFGLFWWQLLGLM